MDSNKIIKLDIKKFSSRLRGLMKEKGLTTYSLGDVVYLSSGAISRYINAKMKPKRTTVEAMAKYFNVNSAWLMGIDDERGICSSSEKSQTEKHLTLSDAQILLLLDCLKIQQMQSKLLTGKENFQLNDIEMVLKDYIEKK